MGLYTLCFAWDEGAVCKEIADEFFPVSVVEKEQILAICKQKQIAGICTIASDVAAPTVAYVAEQLQLVGNSYTAAQRANNKLQMRRCFVENGIQSPRFVSVTDVSDADAIAEALSFGFPLIVKPVDRSGSLGVQRVDTHDELLEAINEATELSFSHTAIVEEYVDGREVSVEFISYNGKHYALQVTDKVTTEAPHYVELAHHQPALLTSEQVKQLYALTQSALTALRITNGASHTEVKISDLGEMRVIEVGARMGGDFIGSHLVQLSTGYDYLQGVIDVAMGEFAEPVIEANNSAGVYFLSAYTPQVKHYIEHKEQYSQIVDAAITSSVLQEVTCSSQRSGYFIYRDKRRFNL